MSSVPYDCLLLVPHVPHCLPAQEAIPFAVVGSNTVIEVNNKKVRGRMYPWGVAEVENVEHCDFTTLRNMLVRYRTSPERDGCMIDLHTTWISCNCSLTVGVVSSIYCTLLFEMTSFG